MYAATRLIIMAVLAISIATINLVAQPEQLAYRGRIRSVHTSRIVVATVGDPDVSFGVDDQTRIMVNGRLSSVNDLKPGFLVQVATRDSNGGLLAADWIRASH